MKQENVPSFPHALLFPSLADQVSKAAKENEGNNKKKEQKGLVQK